MAARKQTDGSAGGKPPGRAGRPKKVPIPKEPVARVELVTVHLPGGGMKTILRNLDTGEQSPV